MPEQYPPNPNPHHTVPIPSTAPDWIQKPDRVPAEGWAQLTARERAFIVLFYAGKHDTEIAPILFYSSVSGVRMLKPRVFTKLRKYYNA